MGKLRCGFKEPILLYHPAPRLPLTTVKPCACRTEIRDNHAGTGNCGMRNKGHRDLLDRHRIHEAVSYRKEKTVPGLVNREICALKTNLHQWQSFAATGRRSYYPPGGIGLFPSRAQPPQRAPGYVMMKHLTMSDIN